MSRRHPVNLEDAVLRHAGEMTGAFPDLKSVGCFSPCNGNRFVCALFGVVAVAFVFVQREPAVCTAIREQIHRVCRLGPHTGLPVRTCIEKLPIDGKNGVVLRVQKSPDANTAKVVKEVISALPKLQGVPPSVKATLAFDRVIYRAAHRDSADRNRIEGISKITVPRASDNLLRFENIADVVMTNTPVETDRKYKQRIIEVTANVTGRVLGSVSADIQSGLDQMKIPTGFHVIQSGNIEQQRSTFSSLPLALILAIVMVNMAMASQFQ